MRISGLLDASWLLRQSHNGSPEIINPPYSQNHRVFVGSSALRRPAKLP
jgi:hypothetical protein